jgi:cytochrome c-type biogenesis protein CcmH/NrfF
MSLLWIVPVVVLGAGAVAILAVLRQTDEAVADLRAQLVRFGDVRMAMARVRADAAKARDSLEGLRGR